MTPHQVNHLTEEQFAESAFSGGEMPAQAGAHLQECAACREELAALQASVESFNEVSLAWSESRPAESLRARVRDKDALPRWAVVSWALAGSLAVASAVSIGSRYEQHRESAQASTSASTEISGISEISEAQIERDNKLLMDVDQATSSRPASPLQEYGIEEPAATRGKGQTSQSAND